MSQPYQTQISGAQMLRFTIASVNRKRSTYPTLPVQEITNILSEREKTLLCEKMCQFIHLIFHTYTQPAKTTRDWHLCTPHTECLDFLHFPQIGLTSLNCLPLSRVNEPRVSNKPTLWKKLWLGFLLLHSCVICAMANWLNDVFDLCYCQTFTQSQWSRRKDQKKKWRRQHQRHEQPNAVFWLANGITMIKTNIEMMNLLWWFLSTVAMVTNLLTNLNLWSLSLILLFFPYLIIFQIQYTQT